MTGSSAAQGAAFVSTQIANRGTLFGFYRDSICAQSAGLAPGSHKRAAGDVYAPPEASGLGRRPASTRKDLCEGAKRPIWPRDILDGCSKRWDCGLRFPVDFSAAAWLANSIGTAYVGEEGSNFGRAPPSARQHLRPASKLRPNDTKHPGRRRRAPEHS